MRINENEEMEYVMLLWWETEDTSPRKTGACSTRLSVFLGIVSRWEQISALRILHDMVELGHWEYRTHLLFIYMKKESEKENESLNEGEI